LLNEDKNKKECRGRSYSVVLSVLHSCCFSIFDFEFQNYIGGKRILLKQNKKNLGDSFFLLSSGQFLLHIRIFRLSRP
jgi:hypothetical protein